MRRVWVVVAALLLGLIGLLMSLCGGGVLVTFAFQDSFLGLLATTSGVIGLSLLWGAARLLKTLRKAPSDPDSQ